MGYPIYSFNEIAMFSSGIPVKINLLWNLSVTGESGPWPIIIDVIDLSWHVIIDLNPSG